MAIGRWKRRPSLSGQDTLELDVQLEREPQRLDPIAVAATNRPHPKQGLITSNEITSVLGSSTDAYDLVRQLRPSYLRGRGASDLGDPGHPTVLPLGAKDTLHMNPLQQMESTRLTVAARNAKPQLPKVVIDDGIPEDLDALHRVPANTVKEIRFLSSIEATTRYGPDMIGGVIIVILK